LTSQKVLDKGTDYNWYRPWLGDGMLVSTGNWSYIDFSFLFRFYRTLFPSVCKKKVPNGGRDGVWSHHRFIL